MKHLRQLNYKMTTFFISNNFILVIKSCHWGFAYLSSVNDRNDNFFAERRKTIYLEIKNIYKNNITFYIGELDPSSY